MRYTGNKSRIAKEILPIILEGRKANQWYVEPFVGGANVIDKVEGFRLGSDYNEHLITFLKAVQDGWTPPKRISKEEYKYIKENQYDDSRLTFWAGVCCSYGGKWFGGMLGDYQESKRNKKGVLPNHQDEARRGLIKQIPSLTSIHFTHCNYWELDVPEESIIYCDPPYIDTLKYRDNIDHTHFYHWCRKMHFEGHKVFVSEYTAPEDFTCVWSKEVSNTLSKNKKTRPIEKLFTII
jgi:DNA adenine methylase